MSMTVGQLIQRHRSQHFRDGATTPWTQQDLANEMGWAVHIVQRLEQGNRPLKVAEALKLSELLSIPWEDVAAAQRFQSGQ